MEEDIDLVLAVGAGTIHDLSRFVAHQYRIPFVSVPTAASSDGFTSTVADMTWNGVKKVFQASAPLFCFCGYGYFLLRRLQGLQQPGCRIFWEIHCAGRLEDSKYSCG